MPRGAAPGWPGGSVARRESAAEPRRMGSRRRPPGLPEVAFMLRGGVLARIVYATIQSRKGGRTRVSLRVRSVGGVGLEARQGY